MRLSEGTRRDEEEKKKERRKEEGHEGREKVKQTNKGDIYDRSSTNMLTPIFHSIPTCFVQYRYFI
jgi:hypothetical protein